MAHSLVGDVGCCWPGDSIDGVFVSENDMWRCCVALGGVGGGGSAGAATGSTEDETSPAINGSMRRLPFVVPLVVIGTIGATGC